MTVNGLLLLDKPYGMSSNAALQKVKRLVGAKKAGHTGSLDPLATGMLPILLGEATKLASFLLEGDKTYEVEASLGVTTDTGDSEGQILTEQVVPMFDEATLQQALTSFLGSQMQVPPMYSALKHHGQPLYRLARQGKTIPRAARSVTISRLELLSRQETVLKLRVDCSKGTYIRSLVSDLGELLGCGAHVSQLRRLAVNRFKSDAMIDMIGLREAYEDESTTSDNNPAYVISSQAAVDHLPYLQIQEQEWLRLRQGQRLRMDNLKTDGLYRLVTHTGDFLGIASMLQHVLSPKHVFGSPG